MTLNKYAELNLPIPEASLRGITVNFPSDLALLTLRILVASYGEYTRKRFNGSTMRTVNILHFTTDCEFLKHQKIML
jgi:hypothetical protein